MKTLLLIISIMLIGCKEEEVAENLEKNNQKGQPKTSLFAGEEEIITLEDFLALLDIRNVVQESDCFVENSRSLNYKLTINDSGMTIKTVFYNDTACTDRDKFESVVAYYDIQNEYTQEFVGYETKSVADISYVQTDLTYADPIEDTPPCNLDYSNTPNEAYGDPRNIDNTNCKYNFGDKENKLESDKNGNYKINGVQFE